MFTEGCILIYFMKLQIVNFKKESFEVFIAASLSEQQHYLWPSEWDLGTLYVVSSLNSSTKVFFEMEGWSLFFVPCGAWVLFLSIRSQCLFPEGSHQMRMRSQLTYCTFAICPSKDVTMNPLWGFCSVYLEFYTYWCVFSSKPWLQISLNVTSDSKSLTSFIKKQIITAVKPKVDPITFYKRKQHYFWELSGKMKDCLEIFGHVILSSYIIWQSRWGEVVAFGNMIAVKNDAKFLVSKAEFTYLDMVEIRAPTRKWNHFSCCFYKRFIYILM